MTSGHLLCKLRYQDMSSVFRLIIYPDAIRAGSDYEKTGQLHISYKQT
jgi:hypothetical protein